MRRSDQLGQILQASASNKNISASHGYLLLPDEPAFLRIGENLWENRDGSRIAVLRDDEGKVLRLLGGGGDTHLEPVTFWTNPNHVLIAFGVTVLLSVTAWLGLWRRAGHIKEKTTQGRWLSRLALLAIIPFVWIAVLASQMGEVQNLSFAEVFEQWPPPLLLWMATAATLAAVFGVLLVLGLPSAWRRTQWNFWRKLHYTLHALSSAFLAILLVNWGAVPYFPGLM